MPPLGAPALQRPRKTRYSFSWHAHLATYAARLLVFPLLARSVHPEVKKSVRLRQEVLCVCSSNNAYSTHPLAREHNLTSPRGVTPSALCAARAPYSRQHHALPVDAAEGGRRDAVVHHSARGHVSKRRGHCQRAGNRRQHSQASARQVNILVKRNKPLLDA
jgi:hypothetical protein